MRRGGGLLRLRRVVACLALVAGPSHVLLVLQPNPTQQRTCQDRNVLGHDLLRCGRNRFLRRALHRRGRLRFRGASGFGFWLGHHNRCRSHRRRLLLRALRESRFRSWCRTRWDRLCRSRPGLRCRRRRRLWGTRGFCGLSLRWSTCRAGTLRGFLLRAAGEHDKQGEQRDRTSGRSFRRGFHLEHAFLQRAPSFWRGVSIITIRDLEDSIAIGAGVK